MITGYRCSFLLIYMMTKLTKWTEQSTKNQIMNLAHDLQIILKLKFKFVSRGLRGVGKGMLMWATFFDPKNLNACKKCFNFF